MNTRLIIKKVLFETTVTTFAKDKCGIVCAHILGIMYRLLEFGITSLLSPLILILFDSKYKALIAASVAFFGMKLFQCIIDFFTEDNAGDQMRDLQESNARLEETLQQVKSAIGTLPNDIQTQINLAIEEPLREVKSAIDEQAKVNIAVGSAIDEQAKVNIDIRSEIDYIRPFVYSPYDPPSPESPYYQHETI